jgi:ribose transport system substrate-binding protein
MKMERKANVLKKMVIVFSLLTILFSLLVSCKGNSQKEKQGEQNSRKRITFVVNNVTDPYWLIVHAGMQQAAGELGCDVAIMGQQSSDMTQFAKDIDSAAAANPDGMLLPCFKEELFAENIDNAISKNITVGLVDTDGPNTKRIFYVGNNNRYLGEESCRFVAEYVGEDAKVALIVMGLTAPTIIDRYDGFLDYAKAHYPKMKIITTQESTDRVTAAQKTEQILIAYPEVNAIFCLDGSNPMGAAQTLLEKNLAGKVFLFGLADDVDTLNRIKDGSITGSISCQPYFMGYQAVRYLTDVMNGKEVPTITIPTALRLTKKNVDKFDPMKVNDENLFK